MDLLNDNLIYVAPVLGVVGLVFMFLKSAWVSKQDPGDKKMIELSDHIARGAMAFLLAEWKVLGVFSIITAGLLAWSGTLVETSTPYIAVSFMIGAVFSAI